MSNRHEPPTTEEVPSALRLQVTLAVFMSLTLVLVSGVTAYLVDGLFGHWVPGVEQDLAWKATTGTEGIARSAEFGIAARDEEAILAATGRYRTDPDLRHLVVLDDAGRELLTLGDPPQALDLFVGDAGSLRSDALGFTAWDEVVIEGLVVGRVGLVISRDRLDAVVQLRQRAVLLLSIATMAAVAVSLVFVRFYLGPLIGQSERALRQVAEANATLEGRVEHRTQELAESTGKLQESLDELQTTQRKLVDASRTAGKAEVATTVLHNVGNALNSVNVACEMARERLRRSMVAKLDRAVGLLEIHTDDLATFMTDGKGKHLPAYLAEVALGMVREREALLEELDAMQSSVDHIKVVVATQQTHARIGHGAVEPLDLAELVQDAIRLSGSSRVNMQIHCDENLPRVSADRHKILEILLNLLSNARHAVQDAGRSDVQVHIAVEHDAMVTISVTDDGIGIQPENLDRIFQHGFTTRKEGHGFGLHGSANAAVELGGTLYAESLGEGHGATFTLRIPHRPTQEAAA